MKGFFWWFKSNTKIKRWLFLILIGIFSLCFAISNIIVDKERNVTDLIIIVSSFVVGFLFTTIGIIHIQKRTLELLVKDTNSNNKENVSSLIYNKKVYNDGPKIVVLGGGNGLNSIIKGLKNYTNNITAIVSTSDLENSISNEVHFSSILQEIKDSIIALARDEDTMRRLMNYKFERSNNNYISFGDLFMSAVKATDGNFSKSIANLKGILNLSGNILPVTLEKVKICAELEDGTIIGNKKSIPEVVNSKASKISRVFVNPYHPKPTEGILEAIREADAICFAPGSLYTSVIPNLLIKGVAKEIRESKGLKVYISNLMTEPGQTYNYTLADHIEAINAHSGGKIIDYCIYDTSEIIPEYVRKYNMQGYEIVEQDIQKVKNMGIKVIQRNISGTDDKFIRHDPKQTAKAIIELICDDLKFSNNQNDFKYLTINDKLKQEKKSSKKVNPKKSKKIVENNEKTINRKSKFFVKYNARIKSIQESDIKLKERQKQKEKLNKMQQILKNGK